MVGLILGLREGLQMGASPREMTSQVEFGRLHEAAFEEVAEHESGFEIGIGYGFDSVVLSLHGSWSLAQSHVSVSWHYGDISMVVKVIWTDHTHWLGVCRVTLFRNSVVERP
mmetsp:Transcript_17949/g.24834  ORF Transcript_17949/g.24834 Transcript_17949/m.24834 type:complete len:112 (-) Transcript_17949:328-663(-)